MINQTGVLIVDPVITYTLVSLCEFVNVNLMEAQETNGFLCYKCNIFSSFTIKIGRMEPNIII